MTAPSQPTTLSNIPIPDPSLITTEQITKAKIELRDDIKASISALERVVEERFLASKLLVDTAVSQAQATTTSLHSLVSTQLTAMSDITKVQFNAGQVAITKAEAAAIAVDIKAQTANDTLERLVEANHTAAINQTHLQFNASREAIVKAEASALAATAVLDVRINAQFDTANKQFHAALDALERQINAAGIANRERAMEQTVATRVALETALDASTKMANARFDSAQQALTKVDSQLALSATTAQAAVTAVDGRSIMRHEAANSFVHSSEEKMISRIIGLQQMIDLRAEMNQTAIAKAEQANDQRLISVVNLSETLTVQARNFVTISVLDARTNQIQAQLDALERVMRSANESMTASIATLNAQLAAISSRLAVGGGAVAVLFLAIQLVLNLLHR